MAGFETAQPICCHGWKRFEFEHKLRCASARGATRDERRCMFPIVRNGGERPSAHTEERGRNRSDANLARHHRRARSSSCTRTRHHNQHREGERGRGAHTRYDDVAYASIIHTRGLLIGYSQILFRRDEIAGCSGYRDVRALAAVRFNAPLVARSTAALAAGWWSHESLGCGYDNANANHKGREHQWAGGCVTGGWADGAGPCDAVKGELTIIACPSAVGDPSTLAHAALF